MHLFMYRSIGETLSLSYWFESITSPIWYKFEWPLERCRWL